MAKKSVISMNADVTADIFTYLVNDEILKNLKLKDVGGQEKINIGNRPKCFAKSHRSHLSHIKPNNR